MNSHHRVLFACAFRSASRQRTVLTLVAFLLPLLLSSLPLPARAIAAATGQPPILHVAANQLVNENGQRVRIFGVDRSGTEYACVQGRGCFHGPGDTESIIAITSWGANAVRVPLNEGCWLGINGMSPTYGGSPTAYGAGFRDHLAEIATAPSWPSSSAPNAPLNGTTPVISRDVPAYVSGGYPASYANDGDYATVWRSLAAPSPATPQWLAYDLSGVPAVSRRKVMLAWYNDTTSPYWQGISGAFYGEPLDYSIDVATAPGGAPPVQGWTPLVSVTGNTYSGRMHVLDLGNATWVRLRITASSGANGNEDVAIQMDIHDVSDQVDSWLFLGDSITMECMRHANITGIPWAGGNLSQLVSAATGQVRFPGIVNGGVGGTTMEWAAQNIDTLVEPFPGRYVAIAYGTNDANARGMLRDSQVAGYYQNLLKVIDAVQARGLIAIVPSIPWGCASDGQLGANAQTLNSYVHARLSIDRPAAVQGPDLWTFYHDSPQLLRDCLHPTYSAQLGQLNGYEQYQRQWVSTILGLNSPLTTPMVPTPTAAPAPLPSQTPGSLPSNPSEVQPSPGPGSRAPRAL